MYNYVNTQYIDSNRLKHTLAFDPLRRRISKPNLLKCVEGHYSKVLINRQYFVTSFQSPLGSRVELPLQLINTESTNVFCSSAMFFFLFVQLWTVSLLSDPSIHSLNASHHHKTRFNKTLFSCERPWLCASSPRDGKADLWHMFFETFIALYVFLSRQQSSQICAASLNSYSPQLKTNNKNDLQLLINPTGHMRKC